MKRVVVIVCLLLPAGFVRGGVITNVAVTNFVWTGAASSSFGNAGNWRVDQPTNNAPAPNAPNSVAGYDFVIFQGNVAHLTIDLGSSVRNVRGMEFDSVPSSAGFTFNVSGVSPTAQNFGFSIRPDGIANFDSHVQTFNVPIVLNSYGGGGLDFSTPIAINAAAGGFNFTGAWSGGAANKATIDLNGALLTLKGSGDITIGSATTAGIISSSSGPGGLDVEGTGNVFLLGTSANTYSGETLLNSSATIHAEKANALGEGTTLILNNNPFLEIQGFNQSVGQLVLKSGTIDGIGTLFIAGSNNVQSGTLSVKVGGAGSVTKTTSGTVTLSGPNTFAGGLNINAGTIKLKNSSGSGTGTGAVAVNSGGTLAGDGFSTSVVTINNGGKISPGDLVGTLTTGSQIWKGGGAATFAINSVHGAPGTDPGWSSLNINGSLTLDASITPATPFVIDLTSLTLSDTPGAVSDFDAGTSYDFLFASSASAILNFLPSEFPIDTSGFMNDTHGGTFTVALENNDKELHIVYIPEPSTVAIALLGGFGVMFGLRMRRSSK